MYCITPKSWRSCLVGEDPKPLNMDEAAASSSETKEGYYGSNV